MFKSNNDFFPHKTSKNSAEEVVESIPDEFETNRERDLNQTLKKNSFENNSLLTPRDFHRKKGSKIFKKVNRVRSVQSIPKFDTFRTFCKRVELTEINIRKYEAQAD